MKTCSKCGEGKPLTEYYLRNKVTGNYRNECNECASLRKKKYYQENKEAHSIRNKKWQKENKEKVKTYSKLYRTKNKGNRKKYIQTDESRKLNSINHKKRYEKNKTAINIKHKIYRDNNKQKIKDAYAKFVSIKENRDKRNLAAKKYRTKDKSKIETRRYYQEKYHNDIEFKLTKLLRRRISSALKGSSKSAKTIELLGCQIEIFKAHLQRQFTKGMSFDNHGEWHIDHIVPCASFDLTDPQQQKECFNYRNLQPLWAKDNLTKQDKLPVGHQLTLVV